MRFAQTLLLVGIKTVACAQYQSPPLLDGYFIDYVKAAEQCSGAKVTTQPRLGILDRDYDGEDQDAAGNKTQWARFAEFVIKLNEQSKEGESYKLAFIIRHGFGVHNQVMEDVGSEAWKSDWSLREGDGELIWADAHLVATGIAQAQDLARFWVDGVEKDGIPLPESLYTSPLARCLETTKLVYTPVLMAHQRQLQPIVEELLREYLTDHTCDRRSSRTWIRENYPDYIIKDGFTEEDVLWHADRTESMENHVARKRKVLEDIFLQDDSPFISLTTHSYAISAILEVIGAQRFFVSEGAMVPLFIKAEKLNNLPAGI